MNLQQLNEQEEICIVRIPLRLQKLKSCTATIFFSTPELEAAIKTCIREIQGDLSLEYEEHPKFKNLRELIHTPNGVEFSFVVRPKQNNQPKKPMKDITDYFTFHKIQ